MTHPTDMQYALMAKLVYVDGTYQRARYPFVESGMPKAVQLEPYVEAWRAAGWELWDNPLGFYRDEESGYVACVYVNHRTKQVVIASRGTTLTKEALMEDVKAILLGQFGKQQARAFAFYGDVIRDFRGVGPHNMINNNTLEGYQLSFTGHSLGAWLSEACAADYLFRREQVAHTVTFESPGSEASIKAMAANDVVLHQARKRLDITTYFAPPNRINVCNDHIGTMKRLKPAIAPMGKLKAWVQYTLMVHDMSELLFTFDSATGLPRPDLCEIATSWPHDNPIHHRSGEYSAFHSASSQATGYVPVVDGNSIEAIRLIYRAKYNTEVFNPAHMPLKHIHPVIGRFLVQYSQFATSLAPQLANIDAQLATLLGRYQVIHHGKTIRVTVEEGQPHQAVTHWLAELTPLLVTHYAAVILLLSQAADVDARVSQVEQRLSEASSSGSSISSTVSAAPSVSSPLPATHAPALITGVASGARLTDFHGSVTASFADLAGATQEERDFAAEELSKIPDDKKRVEGVGAGAQVERSTGHISASLFNFRRVALVAPPVSTAADLPSLAPPIRKGG